jgi:hypothetical protein
MVEILFRTDTSDIFFSVEDFYLVGYNARALLVTYFHVGFRLGLFFNPEE